MAVLQEVYMNKMKHPDRASKFKWLGVRTVADKRTKLTRPKR